MFSCPPADPAFFEAAISAFIHSILSSVIFPYGIRNYIFLLK